MITAEKLRLLVNHADEADEDPKWASAMRDMLARGLMFFSVKQTLFIAEVYAEVFDEPIYRNEFSAGKIPLGTSLRTAVPDVLKKPLPKKPPGRT